MTSVTEIDVPVWSADELAQYAGVAKTTICRWATEGRLPVIRKFPGRTGVWVFDSDAPDVAVDLAAADRSYWNQ